MYIIIINTVFFIRNTEMYRYYVLPKINIYNIARDYYIG